MELDWSPQSPHIRSLFHPWKPSDGCEEAEIVAAEERLGLRLPTSLRNFYLAWGKRKDVTQRIHPLLSPDELIFRDNALLFWAENQAVVLWGVLCERLEEADPPVMIAINLDEGLEWTPSHAQLSGFLDDMTYQTALSGGAIYTGYSVERTQTPRQIHWLEDHWRKARESPMTLEGTVYAFKYPAIYIREGQAVC